MKLFVFLLILLLAIYKLDAQQSATTTELRTACDCKDAVPLTITKASHYGPTQAPVSFGAIQEFSSTDKNSETSFAQEHNSAWYMLAIKFDGEFQFEIDPIDTTNDYDFLLYPYTDSNFCGNLLKRKVIPIHGNMSNTIEASRKNITGLSNTATQSFHKQGRGNSFSKSIQVKKGEKYMLVLDNVSAKGKGHTIYFYALKDIEIKGTVVNSDSLPVVADIILTDPKGNTVAQTTSDKKGAYQINTAIEDNKNYSLIFSNDSSFMTTQTINTANLKNTNTFADIRAVLYKLKKGAKYKLGNINFYPGSATLLPESFPSVVSLYQLMEKNKRMQIQIEGHVNAAGIGLQDLEERFPGQFQELSEDRAKTIRDYLIKQGIIANKMRVIGLGAKEMLYPSASTEEEYKANRRVEIKVISINGE